MALAAPNRVSNLQATIRTFDVNEASRFSELLRLAKREFGLTDQEIADHFGVSRPTVSRWIEGSSAPHRAFRPVVVRWLDGKARARSRAGHETAVAP